MPGWRTNKGSLANKANESQMAQQIFQTRINEIIGELGNHGFDSACLQYSRFPENNCINSDFCKGYWRRRPRVIHDFDGISSKILTGRLLLDEGSSEGQFLKLKEKDLVKLGVIIYNGILKASDTLIIGAQPEQIVTDSFIIKT